MLSQLPQNSRLQEGLPGPRDQGCCSHRSQKSSGTQQQGQCGYKRKGVQKTNNLCLTKHRCIMCRQKGIRKQFIKKNKQNTPKNPPNTHILFDKLIAQAKPPVTLLSLTLAYTAMSTHPYLLLQPTSLGYVRLVPNTSI